jgi:hypothetical protein
MFRDARIAAVFLYSLLALCVVASAHNIPADFAVQAFVKPEGRTLHVLVRAPLINITGTPDRPLSNAALPWFKSFFELRESGIVLQNADLKSVRLSGPLEASFVSYPRAFAFVTTPSPNDDAGDAPQSLATLLFDYPIRSDASAFAIRTGIDRGGVRVVTAVRFLPPSGGVRAYEFLDDSGLVMLDPHWYQAAGRFVVMGFEHILDGADHLLFLLCLVIPVRRFRKLIPVVTAFTVAHSLTLIASASGLAPDEPWFPPLIEALIAASIVYMAVENIFSKGDMHYRWMTAFGFGLVHGFGFSFVLRNTLQFAGGHLLASLVSFNIGVELGQIFALLLAIPVLDFLFTRVVNERTGTIVLSFAVSVTGAVWLVDRIGRLWEVRVQATHFSAGSTADLLRWLIWIVAIAGALWIADGIRQRRRSTQKGSVRECDS